MLALLPYLVLALEAVLDLDIIPSLSFSYAVCLNGFGCLTNQSKYPLHFSTLAEKICLEISCFSFIKAAVIKQEHVIILCRRFRTSCFLHEDICLRCAAVCAKLFPALLKGCLWPERFHSELNTYGHWVQEFSTSLPSHTTCWPSYDMNIHVSNWTCSLLMLRLLSWQLSPFALLSVNFKLLLESSLYPWVWPLYS